MSGPYVEQTAEPREAATELITDEMVQRAQAAWLAAKQARDGQPTRMRAALAAVADELAERGARAERERLAGELRNAVQRGCWVEQLWGLVHDWEAAS